MSDSGDVVLDDAASRSADAVVLDDIEATMAKQAGQTAEQFMNDYTCNHRLEDDEWVDNVQIKIYPRFKTSDLSGSQWRYIVGVHAFRKGVLIGFQSHSSFSDATESIAAFVKSCYGSTFCAFPDVHGMSRRDPSMVADRDAGKKRIQKLCMHLGCDQPATNLHRMVTDGCRNCGSTKEVSRHFHPYLRRFCDAHNNRGCQGLSDCNSGLELIAGNKAGTAKTDPRLVSESVFGGVVTM
jgi:hypothetical protein